MKKFAFVVCLLMYVKVMAQEPEISPEMEEAIIQVNEVLDEEDDRLQQLHALRRNPMDLNQASAGELQVLGLNVLQIAALIEHRKRFGDLIALQELQAVKGWDLRTIRAVLPYVMIGQAGANRERMTSGWKKGTHFLLLRLTRTLEKSKGFLLLPTGKEYQGSPQKMLLRYQYKSVAGIQSGFTAEKDAGEMVFKRSMKSGFDFTSAHINIKNVGVLESLVIGDYKVQTGQGLIIWQGNGFRKGAGSLLVKRQGPLLLPYTGAGEFLFSRGLGMVWSRRNWKILTFYSDRKMSASLDVNAQGEKTITTILQSGLHRSVSELNKRKNVRHQVVGITARYHFASGHLSVNTIQHLFSLPFAAGSRPYSYFDFTGNKISNASVDYSYTRDNFHASGEMAVDQSGNIALVNSLMIALHNKADLVVLHRQFKNEYSSFQSNAFADQPVPKNESGLYAGISLRPEKSWQVDAYGDLAMFPWLKYRADAPCYSAGYSFLIRYVPSRKAEWYVRYRNESAAANALVDSDHFDAIESVARSSMRMHVSLQLSSEWAVRQRFELTRINYPEEGTGRYGRLYYAETFYKPAAGKTGYNCRLMLFNTDGFDTRIYSYEQDVLFNASVPALDGKGVRYYFNLHRKVRFSKVSNWKADAYLRWAQSIYADKKTIGSGKDEIDGNKRSEVKLQLIISSG